MAINAYRVRVVTGRLFLNRREVSCHVDHDLREIRISSLLPKRERATMADFARAVADDEADRHGTFVAFHDLAGATR